MTQDPFCFLSYRSKTSLRIFTTQATKQSKDVEIFQAKSNQYKLILRQNIELEYLKHRLTNKH